VSGTHSDDTIIVRDGTLVGLLPRNLPDVLPILQDSFRSQDAAKVSERIDHAVATDQGPGINGCIATDLHAITDYRAEFTKTGGNDGSFMTYRDFLMIQAEIGKDYSSTKMSAVSEDGIANVTEMGDLGVVEDHAILELARISQNHSVPNDDVFSDVTAGPDLASFADPGGSFNRGARFNHRTFSDKHRIANE
jgi:hypothetical protein